MPGPAVNLVRTCGEGGSRSRLAGLACVLLAAPGPAPASISRSRLRHGLSKQMHRVGGASGACVTDVDAPRHRTLFSWASHSRRILASNTKLFTMAAAARPLRPRGNLEDEAVRPPRKRGRGPHPAREPGRGRRRAIRRSGARASRATTDFRSLRWALWPVTSAKPGSSESPAGSAPTTRSSTAAAGYPTTGVDASGRAGPAVGPLVQFGHRSWPLRQEPGAGRRAGAEAQAPGESACASREAPVAPTCPGGCSPSRRWEASAHLGSTSLIVGHAEALEQLLRRDAPQAPGGVAARRQGHHPARLPQGEEVRPQARHRASRLENGSGLSRSNRASPRQVGRLLVAMSRRSGGGTYRRSLPLAGEEGTVAHRMNGTAADGRCRTKTGTLIGVSALSGYCRAGHGVVAFSILMNSVDIDLARARSGQDGRADRALQTLGG